MQAIYPELKDQIVVTIMGAVAAELYSLGHRQTSSTWSTPWGWPPRWGWALRSRCREHKVVVLDGDGSLLMNLGTLTTMARYRPGNLVHIVFDNESLLSVGGFPTATATGTDLAGMARAAGIPHVAEADTPDSSKHAVRDALAGES